ncbi:MAG: hypothetical protein OXH52_21125 [Gammaproteobacteria bacterium]|nr:hypothetical protein [Gammaproteobacteria bacterium]
MLQAEGDIRWRGFLGGEVGLPGRAVSVAWPEVIGRTGHRK